MYMKKILLSAISIFTLSLAVESQTVSYKILDNEVNDIKKVNLQINPVCIDVNPGVNFATFGAGIAADVSILKRLVVNGGFRMAYLDANSGLTGTSKVTGLAHPVCKGGTNRSTYFESGIAFYLFDRTKTKNLQVVLHSSSSGRYTYKTSIRVPGNRRRMFGVRGGFFIYNLGTQIGEEDSHQIAYRITSGSDTMKFGDPTILNLDGSNPTYVYTMVNSTVVNVGLSLKSITNLIVTADGYGRKGHTGVYDVYIDLLASPYVSIKDVYTAGGKKWDIKTKDGGFKALGWRFGLSYKGSIKRVGFYYKLEMGERPGLYFGEKDKLLQGSVNALFTIFLFILID